jgi:hypothetical protein
VAQQSGTATASDRNDSRDTSAQGGSSTSGSRGSRTARNSKAEGIAVQADCNGTMPTSAELGQQHPDGRRVTNVGKTAVLTKNGSTQQLTAIDDDSNCRITVDAPDGVDAVALGRAILDTLPPRG